MKSPFPGMDPFFEDPAFLEGFHDLFIAVCMFEIEARLPDGYYSDVRERSQTISADDPAAKVYIPDISVVRERRRQAMRQTDAATDANGGVALATPVVIPTTDDDVEIKENYIEIYSLPDRDLVTAIELLSPWSKLGSGVGVYRSKRATLVRNGVHVVEIDLLRQGRRTELARPLPVGDYYAMLFRADRRPDVDVYGWSYRDKLPEIPIPLRAPDADIKLDLATTIATLYARGRYDRKLRYARDVPKPASPELMDWANQVLRAAGLREQ